MSLPQLPEMQHIMIRGIAMGILTEAQTKAYGQACREHALEEVAHAVESLEATSSCWCAEKIRSLK